MSFIVRCPFCKTEMEAPDDMLGQVAQCTACNREIDLEPVDAVPAAPVENANAQAVRNMRAASIAAAPAEMPRVTWSWAFDAVFKISVAIFAIWGIVMIVIYLCVFVLNCFSAPSRL